MKSICGWCGKKLEPGSDKKSKKVSHGICLECATGLRIEIKDMKRGAVSREERKALLDFDRS